jgi:ribosomal protein S18 acetylase RimI-like enzyme
MTFRLLDGRQAVDHVEEILALHGDVADDRADDAEFARRFRVQSRQPGFALAEARSGGYLIGFADGMSLRPSTSWWRDVTTPLPDDVTAEHPGRTFALVDLLVRASWRRQGIARSLHDLLLSARGEERATVVVPTAAAAAQAAFQNWGWRKVARTRNPVPGEAASDVMVISLPARGVA